MIPDSKPAPRHRTRHRSRQRDELLALLRASDRHPTAAELHAWARRRLPAISLATVYRNLCVLAEEGQIETVASEHGPTRYDGNPLPHHHFVCDACGAIQDIELELPPELERRLRGRYRLRAERARIHFYGLCPACDASAQGAPTDPPQR